MIPKSLPLGAALVLSAAAFQPLVELEDVEWSEEVSDDGLDGVRFRIIVSGEPAARATVWLDEDGTLMGRDQVVEFPGADMRVRERYRWSR